jgi:hypothetical protein
MGTPFSSVIDMALIIINDYNLDALQTTSQTDFDAVMQAYLIKSVPKFTGCLQSLDYDTTSASFNNTLTTKEIDILADYTAITWFTNQLQDVLEFKEALQDADFKRYSTGQNLQPRMNYLDELREKVRQDETDYQLTSGQLNTLMGVV